MGKRGQQRRVHPRVLLRIGRQTHGSVEVVQQPKNMDEIELLVKQAFKECYTAAEAAGKVMTVLKKNIDKNLDSIIMNTGGSHNLLLDRILTFKKQLQ